MRISDWSSDVCSSDLLLFHFHLHGRSSALACGPSGQGLIDGADVRERPRRRRTCVAGRSGSAIDADPLPGAGRAAGSGEGGMTQADLATPPRIDTNGRDGMSPGAPAHLVMTVSRGWPPLYARR